MCIRFRCCHIEIVRIEFSLVLSSIILSSVARCQNNNWHTKIVNKTIRRERKNLLSENIWQDNRHKSTKQNQTNKSKTVFFPLQIFQLSWFQFSPTVKKTRIRLTGCVCVLWYTFVLNKPFFGWCYRTIFCKVVVIIVYRHVQQTVYSCNYLRIIRSVKEVNFSVILTKENTNQHNTNGGR